MSKSPDAFRTISEVAEWLGIPAHVLRFWESKFTQIKPVKRAGGRRYYRPSDMLLLGGIKRLLHDEGQTIKQVQALLRDQGAPHVAEMSLSLDTPSDPMPVIDVDKTVVDFSPPRQPAAAQLHMDLDSPEAASRSPNQPATKVVPEHVGEEWLTKEDEPIQAAVIQPAINGSADVPVTTGNQLKPRIIEIEDIADDALNVSHAGVLAKLAHITALSDAAQAQALICADQLRAFTTSQNNLSAN